MPCCLLQVVVMCGRSLSLGLAFTWPFRTQTPEEPEDTQTITRQLFTRSLWYIVHGEFAQADRELHQLLTHLAEAHRLNQIDTSTYGEQRGRVCSELASVSLILRNYPAAEALIKQTVQDCVRAGLDVSDAAIVELSLKLALIYDRMGRPEESAMGFRYCIGTQERKLASGSVIDPDQLNNEKALLGMSYNYYAQFLYSQNELTQACEYAQKALSIAQQLYPDTHSNCVHLESDIATILIELSRLDEARTVLRRVVDRFAQSDLVDAPLESGPPTDEIRCHFLTQLLQVEAMSGDLGKAKNMYADAEKSCAKLSNTSNLHERLLKLKRMYNL
ncbi:unnamed protein product [Echinostoma caproni]|uniref:TPR_REGION domain-containing protein n=1 Tax=Echinostoma caproni TaxID=27848 RepID=A0A183A918_9TREM|nr:unnamed protein product [Echinostoma caproni]